MLHPDRNGPQADRDLAEVNAAFQRLQAFVRQHGRLPGRSDLAAPPPQRRSGRRWAIGALALAAAVVVLWPQARRSDARPTGDAPTEIRLPPVIPDRAPEPPSLGAATTHLEVGLEASEVERLAGPPMFRSAERWEYGPSEIRFTKGRVSGWYSSPLRPLPVDDMPSFPTTGDN